MLLEFDPDIRFCIRTETFVDRERIVSNLLTLRGFLFEDNRSEFDLVRLVQN